MIVLNKDQQRLPIGGHHFQEAGMTVTGENVKEVSDKVRDLRITNGRPVGDPEREIILYYAHNWPYMVIEDEFAEPKPEPSEDYVRYRHWVYATWKNPPKKLVTHKEATERQAICDNCPSRKVVDWGDSEEAKELARRTFILRCGTKTSEITNFCSCHRWDIGTSVHFHGPEQFSAKSKESTCPKSCWAVKI